MERKALFGWVALAAIVLLGVSALATARGMGMGTGLVLKTTLTDEEKAVFGVEREAMQNAIETKDFAAWKSLHEARLVRMQSALTQENFDAMVLRHEQMQEVREAMQDARESGDYTQVNRLREQYGLSDELNKGFGKGRGIHRGNGADCVATQ